MKKTFLPIVLSLLSTIYVVGQEQSSEDSDDNSSRILTYSKAQNDDEFYLKDDILLNANFGLRHGNTDFDNGGVVSEVSSMDIWGTAEGGYFIADRFAVGLSINLDVEYVRPQVGPEVTAVDFYGGPFVRWYFVDKLHFQATGAYGIENVKTESGSIVDNNNFNGIFLSGGFGYDIFLNEAADVALQLGAGYVYKSLSNVSNENNKISGGQFKYRLGLVFYFF